MKPPSPCPGLASLGRSTGPNENSIASIYVSAGLLELSEFE